MTKVLPYTIFALGDTRLHQLSTPEGDVRTETHRCPEYKGKAMVFFSVLMACINALTADESVIQLFVAGEVAVELLQECPTAFNRVSARA